MAIAFFVHGLVSSKWAGQCLTWQVSQQRPNPYISVCYHDKPEGYYPHSSALETEV